MSQLQNPLHRLKFLLTATNEHGIHSPFVFQYVTKCLYARPNYSRHRSLNILFKSIAYFAAESVMLNEKEENSNPDRVKILEKQIRQQFPSAQFENSPFDILFTHPTGAEKLLNAASLEKNIHNDSLLLVDGIHKNKTHLSLWKKLKEHPRTTVTMDLYYCGAIFFRQEQAEEHFKIRI